MFWLKQHGLYWTSYFLKPFWNSDIHLLNYYHAATGSQAITGNSDKQDRLCPHGALAPVTFTTVTYSQS